MNHKPAIACADFYREAELPVVTKISNLIPLPGTGPDPLWSSNYCGGTVALTNHSTSLLN
eukprot:520128-Amphidinium_carterae.1